jgi:acetyl esterase
VAGGRRRRRRGAELGRAAAGGAAGRGPDHRGLRRQRRRCAGDARLPAPAAQILLSPNTDLAADTESMREKGRGFTPDARLVHWFNAQWVPDPAHWSDPGVSPLRAADLTGLPRALVVSAEHDPLRDEAEAYARRLAQAGVTTTLRRELGLVHNPVMLADVSPACTAALDRVIADVRRMVTAPD